MNLLINTYILYYCYQWHCSIIDNVSQFPSNFIPYKKYVKNMYMYMYNYSYSNHKSIHLLCQETKQYDNFSRAWIEFKNCFDSFASVETYFLERTDNYHHGR